MARSDFGGTTNDFLYRLAPFMKPSPGVLTFWDAESGGTQHTDLLLNDSPVTSITIGTDGLIPTFQGPDGVTTMYADEGVPGGKRGRMVAEGRQGPVGPEGPAGPALPEEQVGELASMFASYLNLARDPEALFSGAVTRSAGGAATSAPVTWPDGTPGTYTADTVNATFTDAVDAWHVTYGSPVTKTFTQPAVTRNGDGDVTNWPAVTVA